MGKKVKNDYSKTFKNDGQILSKILGKAEGMEYLGFIAYALYKIAKNDHIGKYMQAHPDATDDEIQDQKNFFRYSHCTDKEINNYLKDAKNLDDQMYGKKIEKYIEGFENGAKGEREHLKNNFEDLLSKKVGEAIDGKLEKKSNFGRGVLQSFLGTIAWIVLVIIVCLYLKFGNIVGIQVITKSNETSVQQIRADTVNTENDTTGTVKYNQ